jgi:serine/threonine protein kinase
MDPKTHGLAAGTNTDTVLPGVKAYHSNVRIVKNTVTGAIRGIRKIVTADKEGLFGKTGLEKIYLDELRQKPGFEQHVLPYKQGHKNAGSVYLNFNWKDGSDLFDYVQEHLPTLSDAEKRKLIVDIAKSLKWLADQGFIHGDVKFQNLYRGTDGRIYLLDFGEAVRMSKVQHSDVVKAIGQFGEMIAPHLTPEAPEFPIDQYGDNWKAAIIAFYDEMIRRFSPGGQGGGRRRYRKKTQRRNKRRRATRRR